jgi:hypothetical protein
MHKHTEPLGSLQSGMWSKSDELVSPRGEIARQS